MDVSEPWYQEGLSFKCTGCGQCCTGSPGYVWIDESEVAELAAFLNISLEEFVRTYTRRVHQRLALIEHPRTYDCVFLKDRKCQVYGARPKQCRTFPWWPEHLKSRKHWEETARRCEGINHPEAPLVSLAEIEKNLEQKK